MWCTNLPGSHRSCDRETPVCGVLTYLVPVGVVIEGR